MAEAKANNKMSISNLSKIFGPTIVGFSTTEPKNILDEIVYSSKVFFHFC